MSWWIYLEKDDVPVDVDEHREGGTVAIGGASKAEVNVTWNYSYFYYNEVDEDDGIRWLDGRKAEDTIEVLEDAIGVLGTEPHQDCQSYWCPSTGRAGAALATLLEWAKENPEAKWRVS